MSDDRIAGTLALVALLALLLFIALWDDGRASEPHAVRLHAPAPAEVAEAAPPPVRVARRTEPAVSVEAVAEDAPADVVQITNWTVRDVWNGEPVASLELTLDAKLSPDEAAAVSATESDGDSLVVSTTPAGDLRLPETVRPSALSTVSADWKLLQHVEGGETLERTLWAHAMIHVSGSVGFEQERGGDPCELDRVALTAWAHGTDTYVRPPDHEGEWIDEFWLARRRINQIDGIAVPDREGRFSARVPRLPGLSIQAHVPESLNQSSPPWRPVMVAISDADAERRRARVRFYFRHGYQVEFQVADDQGAPVADSRVVLYVVKYVAPEEFTPSFIRSFGHACSGGGNMTADQVSLVLMESGRTDENGRVRLILHADGLATVYVRPTSDHQALIQQLSHVSDLEDSTSLRLQPPVTDYPVRLQLRGTPLSGRRVIVGDLSLGPVQPAFVYELSDDGGLPSRLLQLGHRYKFSVMGPNGGPITARTRIDWNGERVIELKPPASE